MQAVDCLRALAKELRYLGVLRSKPEVIARAKVSTAGADRMCLAHCGPKRLQDMQTSSVWCNLGLLNDEGLLAHVTLIAARVHCLTVCRCRSSRPGLAGWATARSRCPSTSRSVLRTAQLPCAWCSKLWSTCPHCGHCAWCSRRCSGRQVRFFCLPPLAAGAGTQLLSATVAAHVMALSRFTG